MIFALPTTTSVVTTTFVITQTGAAGVTLRRPTDGKTVPIPAGTSSVTLDDPGAYQILGDFIDESTGSVTVNVSVPSLPGSRDIGAIGMLPGYFKRFQRWFLDPVNTTTGSFVQGMPDLSLPGRGAAFEFSRSYDSRNTGTSVLGPGWDHLYDQRVTIDAGGNALWRPGTGGEVAFGPNGSGGFTTPPGVLGSLTVVAGGGWGLTSQAAITSRFDATGALVSVKDRSGQGLTFGYASGRVSTVTDASGRSTTFTYGTTGAATGLLTSITTAGPRTISFGYSSVSGQNRLTSFTDTRGKTTTYSYDTGGRLASQIDANGHTVVANVYDAQGRVIDQADPLGKHSTFVWDDVAEKVTITDSTGAVTVHDSTGAVLSTATNSAGTESNSYSTALDQTAYTDASGRSWFATYDARGNMLTRTAPAPLSYVENWTYDLFNDPLTYTDARGTVTTYSYDSMGRLLTRSIPTAGGTATTTYTWNPDGTLASMKDPRNAMTTYLYSTAGYLTSATDPSGTTTYTYDPVGRVLTVVEPRGNVAGGTPSQYQTTYTYETPPVTCSRQPTRSGGSRPIPMTTKAT